MPRGNAYCIGNGPSRKDFDLNRLKATGQTYGCNALYRDFMPDFIFSVDHEDVNADGRGRSWIEDCTLRSGTGSKQETEQGHDKPYT